MKAKNVKIMIKSLQVLLLIILVNPSISIAEKDVMYIYTAENCATFVVDSTDQRRCFEIVQDGQTYTHRFGGQSFLADHSSNDSTNATNYEGIIKGIILVCVGLLVYFIPSLVSISKARANSGAIIALNLLLGWTLVGWVVALVWAMTDADEKTKPAVIQTKSQISYADLEKLAELRDKGILTVEEFEAKKKRILSE